MHMSAHMSIHMSTHLSIHMSTHVHTHVYSHFHTHFHTTVYTRAWAEHVDQHAMSLNLHRPICEPDPPPPPRDLLRLLLLQPTAATRRPHCCRHCRGCGSGRLTGGSRRSGCPAQFRSRPSTLWGLRRGRPRSREQPWRSRCHSRCRGQPRSSSPRRRFIDGLDGVHEHAGARMRGGARACTRADEFPRNLASRATRPPVQYGRPCNVATRADEFPRNMASRAIWPPVQCGRPCNVAARAMWPPAQTSAALREQEQTAWASRMRSRMEGVEAMLDEATSSLAYSATILPV
jgi:hypothetical protein